MWNRSCAAAVLSAAGLAALLPGPAMAVDRRVELVRRQGRKVRLSPAGVGGRGRAGGATATITPPGVAAGGNVTSPLSKSSKARTSSSKNTKSSKSSSGSSSPSRDSRDVDFDVVCPIRQDDTSGQPSQVKFLGRPGATGLAATMLARDKARRKFAGRAKDGSPGRDAEFRAGGGGKNGKARSRSPLGRKPLRKNTFAKPSECDAADEDPPAEARTLQEFIPQIVGGQDVDPPRKFGFFASWEGCAGSLIAPNLVLTAAHCGGIQSETVTLGLHKIDVERDVAEFGFVEHIPIARRIIHPCYDASIDDFDFMILELESSSEMYSDRVVELDDPADPVELDDGKLLTVMGFGLLFSTIATPIFANVMQEVSVPFDSDCGMYPPDSITDRMFCAGIAGADACQGDSGGAIVDPDTGKLIGVVSQGRGCGLTGFPGIYARVSSVFDWITAHIDELGSDTLTASPSSAECDDGTPGWYSRLDPLFNCILFAEFPDLCTNRDVFPNGGLTADEACCACAALVTDNILDPFPDRSDTSADFDVAFQYDGAYQAAPHGFVQPTVTSGTVLLPDSAVSYEFNLVDVAVFTAILPPEGVLFPDVLDLDLILIDPNGETFFSVEAGTDEIIEILQPEDGIWTLTVDGFFIFPETTRRSADFDLYTWITPLASGGSLTVDSAPVSATFGQTESISISWPSIAPEEWPIGAISHTGRGVIQAITVVAFDPPLFPPIPSPSIDAPLFEEGSGESGTLQFDVTFGYTGGYTAAAHGLVPPIVVSDEVVLGRWTVHEYVLSGLALFQAFTSQDFLDPLDPDTDLDLYLVNPLGQLVASSGTGTIDEFEPDGSDEFVEVDFPMDGTWSVYVYADVLPFGSSSTGYDLLTWSVSATPGGNLSVDSAPSSATSGTTGTVQVSWSGATAVAGPDGLYTGVISHTNEDDGSIVLTEIVIDNWASLT